MIKITTADGVNIPIYNNASLSFKSVFPDQMTAGQTALENSVMEINVTELRVRNEGYEYIKNWKNNYSIARGIPVTVTAGNINLPYYIDLTDNAVFAESECRVKIKRYKGKDHFFQIADALSFSLLADEGVNFPIGKIPYEIHRDDIGLYALNLSLMFYNVSLEVARQIRNLAEVTANFVAALDISPSHAIAAGIILAAQTAWTVAVIAIFVLLADRLLELIFPLLRYFNGIKMFDLLQTACNAKGFTFESDTLSNMPGVVYLPVPIQKTAKNMFDNFQNELKGQFYTKGYPTDYDGNMVFLGTMIRAVEVLINGKTKVIDGVVKMERRDYWNNQSSGVVVTPGLANQSTLEDEYRYNSERLWRRQYIQYSTDPLDINTLDNNNPNDTEVGTGLVLNPDPSLDLISGIQNIRIPFALGTPKTDFTKVQKLALEVLRAIDAGFGTNVASGLEKRIGVLKLSGQYFTVPKILYCDNQFRQTPDYLSKIGATAIRQNYYSIENISNVAGKIRENVPIPMTMDQFEQAIQFEELNINGIDCPVLEIEYIQDDSLAVVTYKQPDDWANGKIDTFVIN